MPILDIKDIAKHTRLYVWRMDDNPHAEDSIPPSARARLQSVCNTRKEETAAIYSILKEATGDESPIIEHESCGKPFLTINGIPTEYKISITHTRGYASVILSTTRSVAVDMEYRGSRITRIADRFLRTDELERIIKQSPSYESCRKYDYDTLTRLILHWCAKETMYKYYSDKRLTFQNILVSDIGEIANEGCFECRNLINSENLKIHFTQNEDFILTYCYENPQT